MKKIIIALFFALSVTALTANAITFHGVDISDSLTLPNSGPTLVLNGAGLREKFFKDIYIGALYLESQSSDANTILNDSGPASVLMHFLYGDIDKEKITNGWTEGLEKNVSSERMQQLQTKLSAFNKLFRVVKKGDSIRIDYVPGVGTQVRINGEWRGTVEGNDFFRALLAVWLGDKPVTKSLREGMLGNNRE